MVRIGWIGLGAMGAPMAAYAAHAGHDITTYDVAPDRGDAASAADVARDADIVVLMVATADQAEAALAEAELAPDTVLLVMSTVGPAAVEQWAKTYTVVDAPVSGGVARAGDGDLLIMVSGAADAIERVRPLLDTLARSAPVVGDRPGDGQKVKLVNQLLCGVHIAAAAEALAFAEAMGLDAGAVRDVIRDGAAASFMLDDRGERMVQPARSTRPRAPSTSSSRTWASSPRRPVRSTMRPRWPPRPRRCTPPGSDAGLGRMDDSSVIEVARGNRD